MTRWAATSTRPSGSTSRPTTTVLKRRSLPGPPFFMVRPARAHSWRWKSSRDLATGTERKRKGGRVTDRLEEAWKVTHGPTDRNRIRGAADQGERAMNREALVANGTWRKSGGRVGKECALTRGDLALRLKGRHAVRAWSEESAEAIVVVRMTTKGRTEERARRPVTSKGHGPR